MISRALGPEFGGSIGVIFVVANVFGSATYIIGQLVYSCFLYILFVFQTGFTEALLSNLGEDGTLLSQYCNDGVCPGLPDSYLYKLAYGSAVLLFCLFVCLVGAGKLYLLISL